MVKYIYKQLQSFVEKLFPMGITLKKCLISQSCMQITILTEDIVEIFL